MIIELTTHWRRYPAGTRITVTKELGAQLLADGTAIRLSDDTLIETKPTPPPIPMPPAPKRRGRPPSQKPKKKK